MKLRWRTPLSLVRGDFSPSFTRSMTSAPSIGPVGPKIWIEGVANLLGVILPIEADVVSEDSARMTFEDTRRVGVWALAEAASIAARAKTARRFITSLLWTVWLQRTF